MNPPKRLVNWVQFVTRCGRSSGAVSVKPTKAATAVLTPESVSRRYRSLRYRRQASNTRQAWSVSLPSEVNRRTSSGRQCLTAECRPSREKPTGRSGGYPTKPLNTGGEPPAGV